MGLPIPKPGLVIRYGFLWSSEEAAGATEGAKDRPCAIVVAARRDPNGDIDTIVAAACAAEVLTLGLHGIPHQRGGR